MRKPCRQTTDSTHAYRTSTWPLIKIHLRFYVTFGNGVSNRFVSFRFYVDFCSERMQLLITASKLFNFRPSIPRADTHIW